MGEQRRSPSQNRFWQVIGAVVAGRLTEGIGIARAGQQVLSQPHRRDLSWAEHRDNGNAHLETTR
jgi:hypothetical protein